MTETANNTLYNEINTDDEDGDKYRANFLYASLDMMDYRPADDEEEEVGEEETVCKKNESITINSVIKPKVKLQDLGKLFGQKTT